MMNEKDGHEFLKIVTSYTDQELDFMVKVLTLYRESIESNDGLTLFDIFNIVLVKEGLEPITKDQYLSAKKDSFKKNK